MKGSSLLEVVKKTQLNCIPVQWTLHPHIHNEQLQQSQTCMSLMHAACTLSTGQQVKLVDLLSPCILAASLQWPPAESMSGNRTLG